MKIIKSFLLLVSLMVLLVGCIQPEENEDPPVEEFTITFEFGYGTEVSSVAIEQETSINLDEYTTSVEGSIFLGWTLLTEQEVLELDTDVPLETGEFIPESDTTFYAVWEIVDDVNPAEGEFLSLLEDFEDVMMFAQYLEIGEVIDVEITNDENTVLSESTTTSVMNLDFVESFMSVTVTNDLGHSYYTQSYAQGDDIVTIYKDVDTYTIEVAESASFDDLVNGEDQTENISEKAFQSVVKLDEFKYEVVYLLTDYFTQAELELMFPSNSGFSYEDVESITVEYDFSNEEDKVYGITVIFHDLVYQDDYFVDFVIEIEYMVLSEYTVTMLKPGDTTIESAKTMDEVFMIFDQEDIVFINQTSGDNFVAYKLTPGDYAVFGDYTSAMANPYLILYDENGIEVMYGSYMHIEEETIVYLNYTAYGDYTNPRKLISIKEVTPLHVGEINPENVNGTMTLEFTEDDLNQVLVFPDGTYDGIMIFDEISLNAGNKLLMVGNTRCEDTETGDVCAIKTYDGSGITINITALTEGSATFTYRLVEYDEISMDSMNPTSIDEIYNGIELENNVEYYIEFDSNGEIYNFDLKILHPGYSITYTATLIDSFGNIVDADWDDDLYIDAGTYTVKIVLFGFHSAVLPIVEVVD